MPFSAHQRLSNINKTCRAGLLWLLGLCALCAASPPGHALEVNKDANYLVDQWTVDSGLPINGINRLVFDDTGYLWLATYDGLVRFDGQHFHTHNSNNSTGIQTNRLIHLFIAHDNHLWVGDERDRFYWFKQGAFQLAQKSTGDDLPAATCAYQTRDKTLFLCTEEGLFASNENLRFDGRDFPKLSGTPTTVFEDTAGCLWVGSDAGMLAQSCPDHPIHYIDLPHQHPSLRINVFDGDNQHTYVGTSNGLYRKIDGQWQATQGTSDLWVIQFAALPNGTFFVRSNQGVYRINPESGERQRIDEVNVGNTPQLKFTHPDGSTWLTTIDRVLRNDETLLNTKCGALDIKFDRSGATWVAGACDGLIRLTKIKLTMRTQDTGAQPVYGVVQTSDGNIWASEKNTVVMYRPDGSHQLLDTKQTNLPEERHNQAGIEANVLRTLHVDGNDTVWVGQTGICQVVGSSCLIPTNTPEKLKKSFISAIFQDHNGHFWVGGTDTLWHKKSTQWEEVPLRTLMDLPSHSKQGNLNVRGALSTQDDALWLATNAYGLIRQKDNQWQAFGLSEGLSGLSIRDLHQDQHGWLWVVTESRGLCVTQNPEQTTPSFQCFTREHGLHSESLHRLIEDEHEHFWLNSNSGVFWVNRQELVDVLANKSPRISPHVYDKHDGLTNAEGNGGVGNAGTLLNDGRIALPTQGGLAIFNPKQDQKVSIKPVTALEHIQLPDGSMLPVQQTMQLPMGQRTFLLKFTALTANFTELAHFEYRMLPNQPVWERIGTEQTMRLTNLEPGTHTIELKAYSPASNTMGDVASFTVTIPAQPWENRLIQAAAVLLLFLMVALWLWQREQASKKLAESLEESVTRRTQALSEQTKKTQQALNQVRKQREEIEQLSAAKSKFFANASHELRTPLAVMLAPLQDALQGSDIPPGRLQAMVRNGQRLERLIEHMLDLERMDANRFPLHPMLMDMKHVIDEAVQLFQPVAQTQGITLTHSSESDSLPLFADPDQMARIIANLLSNAVKFTPKDGRILLRSFIDNDRVVLWVKDSGSGVPDAWKERIFNRFEQISNTTTRSREGAGLGLAMCREIAKLHQGTLCVEDASIGGARFMLDLPLHNAHADTTHPSSIKPATIKQAISKHAKATQQLYTSQTAPATTSPKQPAATDFSQKTILVVEDNPDLRQYIHDILHQDFNVITAEDGEKAFKLAQKHHPDIIVSDIMMPNLDGFGLVKKLRKNPELNSIPLIFLTARASNEDEIDALNLGADQYLRKPFDRSMLTAHVRAALHGLQRLKNRYQRLAAQQATQATQPETNQPPSPPVLVSQALAWMEQHLHDPSINATSAAQALNTSRTTLDRHFKIHHNESFANTLKRSRLIRAQHLLENQQGNISEVAYACGFSSLSHFSRAYRKHHGKPPSID